MVSLTDGEKVEYLKTVRKQLIKLLSLIEAEREGGDSASMYFGGLMFDLGSADWLFDNRLSPAIVKLNGLFLNYAYRTLDHRTVRNKIFESRGILDGMIKEIDGTAPKRGKAKGEGGH